MMETEDHRHERIDQSIEGMFEDDNQKLRQSICLTASDAQEMFRAAHNPINFKDPFHEVDLSNKLENMSDMPVIRMEVGLSVSQMAICEIFTRFCMKKGYDIIDNDSEQVIVINKRSLTLKDYILYCIPWKRKYERLLSCVKMTIKTNKFISKRKITIRGLFGEIDSLEEFLNQVQREMEFFNIKKIKTTKSFFNDEGLNDSLKSNKDKQSHRYLSNKEEITIEIDDEESSISTYNTESNNTLHKFHKILSSNQSNIGKKNANFVKDFMNNYKTIEEAAELLPQPMESIYNHTNETVDSLIHELTKGKIEMKNMIPFCRVSVEEYLFDQLYQHLFSIYKLRYNDISNQYIQQCAEILTHYESNPIKIMRYLDINQNYWLIDSTYLKDNGQGLSSNNEDLPKPYNDSILELRKLNNLKTPREKLNVLLMMHNIMKSSVIDFHSGKIELNIMDDELPIIIYIVLNAQIKDIEAEFAYIEDYINLDQSLENEKKLLTNLRVSVQYIVQEWILN